MKRLIIILTLLFAAAISIAVGQEASVPGAENGVTETEAAASSVWRYIAAALSVGISCIAGGIAVGQIGSAAMGAMSENPELSGKALPYAGLAEGICLWGFLVALLILVIN